MAQEFFESFMEIFNDAELRLIRLLKQKLNAIQMSKNAENLNDDVENEFKTRFRQSQNKREKNVGDLKGKVSNNKSGVITFFKESISLKRLCQNNENFSGSSDENSELS